jgi:chromosome segregation ATPase
METTMTPRTLSITAVLGSALLLCLQPSSAQVARSGGNANTQLMQQMQQLASERTALQAENARMKRELAEVTKERDALKSATTKVSQRVQEAEAASVRNERDREAVAAELAQLKDRTQELVAKFRETAQSLRDVETERSSFKQSLLERDGELALCVDRNVALYTLNKEVLARLEGQSIFSRVARSEPFTRLKRVELENLIEDYRYRAAELAAPAAEPPTSSNVTRQ